jgi:hypothetical protein
MVVVLPPTFHQAKIQISKSTDFDHEPPSSKATTRVDMGMPNVSLNVGSIQMKPNEATLKHCVDEETEVSSPSKKLKNAAIKNPTIGLASKAKLDFLGISVVKG